MNHLDIVYHCSWCFYRHGICVLTSDFVVRFRLIYFHRILEYYVLNNFVLSFIFFHHKPSFDIFNFQKPNLLDLSELNNSICRGEKGKRNKLKNMLKLDIHMGFFSNHNIIYYIIIGSYCNIRKLIICIFGSVF